MSLSPYIMFDGRAEEALNFYARILNGEIPYLGRYGGSPVEVAEDQKDLIMHASMTFPGGTLMASDRTEEAEYASGQGLQSNIHLSLTILLENIHQVYEALAEGGTQTLPLKEQFWGDTFGMLTDKFGVQWMLSAGLDKKDSADEMV
jgi:PhnB protein